MRGDARRRRSQSTRDAGFTLIEMMIVVAIIGVLASAAIPAFMRYMSKARCVEGIHNVKKIADGVRAYYEAHDKVPGRDYGSYYYGYFYGPMYGTHTVCLVNGGVYPASALKPFFVSWIYKQTADMVMFKPEGQTVRYFYDHYMYQMLPSNSITGYTRAARYTSCGANNVYHYHRIDYGYANGMLVVKGPRFIEGSW